MYFESRPLIDTSYSKDAIKLYQAGIIKEHSIGFQTIQSDYDHEKNIRTITEVKLYEGSNVTLGANPATPFQGFKSLTTKDINEQIKNIAQVLKNGDLTDQTFMQLEIALKQLQRSSFELGKKSALTKKDPPKGTPETESLINVLKKHI